MSCPHSSLGKNVFFYQQSHVGGAHHSQGLGEDIQGGLAWYWGIISSKLRAAQNQQ